MKVVEENSRKSLLNTLDKTPLLIENICSQFCEEKPLKGVGKTGSKTLSKSYRNSPQMAQFIELEKLAVGAQVACRSTVRSTGQRSFL